MVKEYDSYDKLVQRAKDCINFGDTPAQVYAMLAIADRLDRLCEILSKR